MAEYEYEPGDEFRNVENALALVAAFRAEFTTPLKDGVWVQRQLRRLTSTQTPDETVAELERIVNGCLYLSSALVQGLAECAQRPPEEVLNDFRSEIEKNIPGMGID
jgi:hypothetical protein